MKPKFHSNARRSPDETSGLKVLYAPAKRRIPQWRWYLILFTVSSPLLYFATTSLYSLAVVRAPGNVMLKQYELRATASGYVERIVPGVGDEISAGQALIQLADPILEEKRIRLSGQLTSLAGGTQEHAPTLAHVLREQWRLAQRLLGQREAKLHTLKTLFEQGAATRGEVAEAEAQTIEAGANLNRAKADIAAERQRHSPKEDLQLTSMRGQWQTEMDLLEHQRAQLQQRAGYDGRVIEIFVNEGEFVNAGASLMLVGLLAEPPLIVAYLEPKYAYQIRVGSFATVTFPDGSQLEAQVAQQPALTKRLPAELVGALGTRPMSVILNLTPATTSWSPERLIHGLPLGVRFQYDWERSWLR